jgi:pheromone shutdown protein TraB
MGTMYALFIDHFLGYGLVIVMANLIGLLPALATARLSLEYKVKSKQTIIWILYGSAVGFLTTCLVVTLLFSISVGIYYQAIFKISLMGMIASGLSSFLIRLIEWKMDYKSHHLKQ